MRIVEETIIGREVRMIVDLRAMRVGAGFAQWELAERLEIAQSQVSRYERNPGAIALRLLVLWVTECGGTIQVGYHCPEKIVTVPGQWVTCDLTPYDPESL